MARELLPTFPGELIQDIFRKALPDDEPPSMKSRLTRAVALSGVCLKWRQVALTTPDMWWISKDLTPEGRVAITERTLPFGLHVLINERRTCDGCRACGDRPGKAEARERNRIAYCRFLYLLELRFENIKVIHAYICPWDYLRRFLALGLRKEAKRLSRLVLEFTPNRDQPSECAPLAVFERGTGTFAWNTPALKYIRCRDVLPCPMLPATSTAEIKLIMSGELKPKATIPLAAIPLVLRNITSLAVIEDHPGNSNLFLHRNTYGSTPSAPITLQNLLCLETFFTEEVGTGVTFANPCTFNLLQFPALQSLTVNKTNKELSLRLFRTLNVPLSSMRNLRFLEFKKCPVRLAHVLNINRFPRLEEVTLYNVEVTEDVFSALDQIVSLPPKLTTIRLYYCRGSALREQVLPRLALALQQAGIAAVAFQDLVVKWCHGVQNDFHMELEEEVFSVTGDRPYFNITVK